VGPLDLQGRQVLQVLQDQQVQVLQEQLGRLDQQALLVHLALFTHGVDHGQQQLIIM
jgi:hypothetical protein